MARAPKKAEAADTSDVERRLWVLEQSMFSGCKPYIAGGKAHCGVCQKALADVHDTGCGTEMDEGCPHKVAE